MPDEAMVVDADGNSVEEDIKVSEIIYFVCPTGFIINGPEEALCGADGSLNVTEDDLPICDCKFSCLARSLATPSVRFDGRNERGT